MLTESANDYCIHVIMYTRCQQYCQLDVTTG